MSRTNSTLLKTTAPALAWVLSLLSAIFDLPEWLFQVVGAANHALLLVMVPVWLAMVLAQWIGVFLLPFWIALIIHRHRPFAKK